MASRFQNPTPVQIGAAVSGWQSYTPTGPWSNTTYTGKWKRNASDIEIIMDMAFTNIPASGSLTFTYAQILNGLGITLNANDFPNNTDVVIPVGTWSGLDSGSNGGYNGVVSYDPAISGLRVVYTTTGGIGATVTPTAPFSWNTADNLSLRVTLPIAEWAGNGTVNLGAGAQVEYVSSTNGTWDAAAAAGNTVYGPSGSPISGALAANRDKVVQWQYPLQEGQVPIIQYRIAGTTQWVDQAQTIWAFNTQGAFTVAFGAYISAQTATTSTVSFYRYPANGTTYGSATGTPNWDSSRYDAWRVVKANPSSPVGFGLAGTDGSSGLVAPYSTSGVVYAGTYTPTLTNGTNVSGNTLLGCQYTRVGKFVSVYGLFNCTTTAAANTLSTIDVSLPIASNLTNAADLLGSGSRNPNPGGTAGSPITCYASTANDRATLEFNSTTTTNSTCGFSFQYEIK